MIYNSCNDRGDGFGAQFQEIICSIVISEYKNEKYIHFPIKKIEHNYDNDPNFLLNIEKLMNLVSYKISENNYSNINYLKMHETYIEFDKNINIYVNSLSMINLKKTFRKNKQKYFSDDYINVAIHIRRLNIDDNRIEGTNTPDSYYINIISIIRKKYINNDKKLKFHIFSQGEISSFDCYINNDVIFHINSDIFSTFTMMVYADILVMSASSFSYSAALLSDGIIYYHHFWHIPCDKWIKCCL
jgi:hypothetical protein